MHSNSDYILETVYGRIQVKYPLESYGYIQVKYPLESYGYIQVKYPLESYGYIQVKYPLESYGCIQVKYPLESYGYIQVKYPLESYGCIQAKYTLESSTWEGNCLTDTGFLSCTDMSMTWHIINIKTSYNQPTNLHVHVHLFLREHSTVTSTF